MKRTALGLVVVLLLGAGIWWLRARSPQANTAAAEAMKPAASSASSAQAGGASPAAAGSMPLVSVSVVSVRRQDVPVMLETSASVVALDSVEVRPQVTATVREIAVREGQQVRAGDVLFRLDDRNDQANLARAQAQRNNDAAKLVDLERQLKRNQDLVAQHFISQAALDSSNALVEAQRAQVQADAAAVQAAQAQLSYATIRAAFGGRVGIINVSPGALVSTGSNTPLATLVRTDPIGVSFAVPERYVQPLLATYRRAGTSSTASTNSATPSTTHQAAPVAASPSTGAPVMVLMPGQSQPRVGHLLVVDNSVDTASGTIKAKARFANADESLWPGQFVSVRVQLDTLKDALVIPQAAVVNNATGRFVFVVGEGNKVELRPIETRYASGAQVAVNGLREGEQVVVEGKQNLRPGVGVQMAGAAASQPRGNTGATTGTSSPAPSSGS